MKTQTSSAVSSMNKENSISPMDSTTLITSNKRIIDELCNAHDIEELDDHHNQEELYEEEDEEQEEMHLRAFRICREHLGGVWNKISPKNMSFTPISGGMSNALYCCSLPESTKVSPQNEPSRVLLRFYGNQFKNCDMSTQVEIFNILSKNDLGPKLYGKFDDGRLEEFLPATSMTNDELMNPEISAIIAKKLALVHGLDVPIIDKNNIWLNQKFKEYCDFVRKQNVGGGGPMKIKFKDGIKESTKVIARELMTINYSKEIKFLNGIFARTRSPIVFSHNDLHQGNILLAKSSKKRPTLEERIVFIDFEYCSYNYRAYDIANHFCEWCFQYDTPEYPHFNFSETRFPSETLQKEFVRHYLEQQKKQQSSDADIIDNDATKTAVKLSHTHNNQQKQYNCHRQRHNHLSSNGKTFETVNPTKRPALTGNGFSKLDGLDDYDNRDACDNNNVDSYHFDDNKKLLSTNGRISNNKHQQQQQHLYRQADLNCDMNDCNNLSPSLNIKIKETNGHRNSNNHHNNRSYRIEFGTDEVDELYEEFQPFFMMANFLWTLWSIKSAQCSDINFGYWEHAMARWQLYRKFKSTYIEQQLKKSSTDNNNQTRRI